MKKWFIVSGFLILFFASNLLLFGCKPQHDEIPIEQPRNIVLLIGDGMGFAHVQAAMLVSDKPLNMMRAQYSGSITTAAYDNLITDSGAAGTALATGFKTTNGKIGMSPENTNLPSIVDIFSEHSKSTGIVVSCAVTHATPACFVSKNISRRNYEEIAVDFAKSNLNVLIGGGRNHFDKRADNQILTEQMQQNGFSFFETLPETASQYKKLLVLTDSIHPKTMREGRGNMLPKGTQLALESLGTNPNGFFLMVEGSQIDWAGHNNDSAYLLTEMLDFDAAVGVAMDFADQHPGTLVIVTADHETGGLTLINDGSSHSRMDDGTNQSLKLNFSTTDHSGVMVPVFAYGSGAENFTGVFDNTDISKKILRITGLTSLEK